MGSFNYVPFVVANLVTGQHLELFSNSLFFGSLSALVSNVGSVFPRPFHMFDLDASPVARVFPRSDTVHLDERMWAPSNIEEIAFSGINRGQIRLNFKDFHYATK